MEAKDEIIHIALSNLRTLLAKEKQAGIREVVEWIERDRYEVNQKNVPALGIIPLSLIHLERWQAKLKEWNVKEE